ncbi:MAG: hypothetical protein II896_05375 [Clostridia bacterium]|nr:hypothetical protein [Clostridia bacterium]
MSKDYSNAPGDKSPISPWHYFGLSILYAVPIVGFIVLLINSLSRSNNVNVRNFSRSFFCGLILTLIVFGVLIIVKVATGGIEALTRWFANLFS